MNVISITYIQFYIIICNIPVIINSDIEILKFIFSAYDSNKISLLRKIKRSSQLLCTCILCSNNLNPIRYSKWKQSFKLVLEISFNYQ